MAYDSAEKLTKLTWNQFGERIDKLYLKVKDYLKKNKIQLSAIVPILREGGFIGLPFAFKFNTLKIIPIQFKYFLKPGISPYDQVPTLITGFPPLYYKLPSKPVFLVTDVFPGAGKTATEVGKELKKKFPGAQLIYICMFQDVSFKKPPQYKAALAGWYTDDTGQLTKEEKKKRGIETKFYLMPWQNEKEEIAPIVGKEYYYDF